MYKYQKVFNWLLTIYCAIFVLYLFNLAAPPDNIPTFIVMAVIGMVALSLSRHKKTVGVSLFMVLLALFLIVKDYNDGITLKGRLNKTRQQSQ